MNSMSQNAFVLNHSTRQERFSLKKSEELEKVLPPPWWAGVAREGCGGAVRGCWADPLLGASSDKLNGEGEGRQPTQSWLHGSPQPRSWGQPEI